MKIIRITTDAETSVHDFPSGPKTISILRELIGPRCDIVEHVMPERLYSALGGSDEIGEEAGSCVSMLVDEEGLYHDLDQNIVGSYLYETDKHGHPIVGTILIVGEKWERDRADFCGLSEEQFVLLYPQLENLAKKARELK